jgi:Tol biopolymer transport system component/tRNA A-37 threonylcarbamoyl transferase component Bud32
LPDLLTRLQAALADRYRLEREVGAGGMATVYLAQDLRHDRKVAVKVLRPELAAVIGAERFLAEIKTTAHLQHPHILPLFDSGEADGFLYDVMPFVEGESLRERLERERQLPITDALRIASEVAGALDYAHRHGVIHRDIKPENILLHDQSALVADFGIARAVSRAAGSRMTETGMSLGTPHYMSPEQAMGEREITARSDVYALGAVTYEMLTGEPPFTGPTAQAIVARVLTEQPRPLIPQRHTIPPNVQAAVLTALEKLPADRFGSTMEFVAALTARATTTTRAATISREGRREQGARNAGRRIPAIIPLLFVAIAVGAFFLGTRMAHRSAPPLELGQSVQITSDPGLEVQPAISPDGRSVAYAAGTSSGTRIYVRQVAGGRVSPLTDDTTASQANPRWSPDGTRILFLAQDAVFSAPASGGAARQEIPAGRGSAVTSAAWAPDGQTIAYVVADSLFLRDAAGPTRLLGQISEPSLCTWSPEGTLIACASGNAHYLSIGNQLGNLSPNRIVVCRVRDGAVTTVTDSISLNVSPAWSPDGRWLYYVSSRRGPRDLYALRISQSGHASGQPVRLSTGLGAQSISISANGARIAYAVYTDKSNIWSLPVPSHPPVSTAAATPVTTGSQVIEGVRLSPDGRWLYYDSDRAGNADIYRRPLAGGEAERLTTDPADDFAPDPSPDGREVAFHSWRSGSRDVYVLPLDGRPLQRVTSSPGQELLAVWSPDGSALAYQAGYEDGSIWLVRRHGNNTWGKPLRRLASGLWPSWSPDGKRLAYGIGRLGGGGSLGLITVDSGAPQLLLDASQPGRPGVEQTYWSTDGRTIYFKSHDVKGNASIWSIPSAGGTPRLLVRFDDPARPSYRSQWAIGGNRIYFPIQDRQSDVWVMETESR